MTAALASIAGPDVATSSASRKIALLKQLRAETLLLAKLAEGYGYDLAAEYRSVIKKVDAQLAFALLRRELGEDDR